MTFVFASWTVGAALLFSAIKNMSVIQLVRGEPGPGQPPSIVDTTFARGQQSGGGTSTPLPQGRLPAGAVIWTNPDGSKVKVAAWIALELKRVGAHPHIESGVRTEQEQREACAHTSGPCAEPGTSNHEKVIFPGGAIDVRASEAPALSKKLKRARSPLKWAGKKDSVHFSHPHNGGY